MGKAGRTEWPPANVVTTSFPLPAFIALLPAALLKGRWLIPPSKELIKTLFVRLRPILAL